MIFIYTITLLIVVIIPVSLYFEKIGDIFIFIGKKIKSTIISLTISIKKNSKRKRNDETNKLIEKINTLQKSNDSFLAETIHLKRINSTKENEIKTLKENNEKLTIELDKKIFELEHSKKTEPLVYQKDSRDKYPKPFRCKDGDYVRSKSERDIDDFFFDNRIWHIYEEDYSHPITHKTAHPDFYLPDYNLYIEYFGKKDKYYLKKKEEKIIMYTTDKSINFEYLTYEDDYQLYKKLKEICYKYSIPTK